MANTEGDHLAARDGEGPVAFKDAVDVEATPARPPTAHTAAAVSAARVTLQGQQLVRVNGYWVFDSWAQGVIAMRRGGLVPRATVGDVLLASLPKSGTTWLKALAFATMARRAWPPASPDHPLRRLNPHDCVPLVDSLFAVGRDKLLDELPSPRLMSTHMPLSLLPATVADGSSNTKIIYICRDQKDRLVSVWHFRKRNDLPDLSLQEVYESVCNGTCFAGPVWDHMLEYWRASNADPGRVLFLKYEEVLQHPGNTVRKLAHFVGQPFSNTEEEADVVAEIVKLCSLENLRSQKVNKEGIRDVIIKFSHDSYFRKGMAGDWRNHMTPELGEHLDSILCDKLDGSGLTI
uniref:Sulfotransferase n=1 Tax=Leersia perrieri TaxID=77586 RepID=A0A0D9X5P6_9ORYZ